MKTKIRKKIAHRNPLSEARIFYQENTRSNQNKKKTDEENIVR